MPGGGILGLGDLAPPFSGPDAGGTVTPPASGAGLDPIWLLANPGRAFAGTVTPPTPTPAGLDPLWAIAMGGRPFAAVAPPSSAPQSGLDPRFALAMAIRPFAATTTPPATPQSGLDPLFALAMGARPAAAGTITPPAATPTLDPIWLAAMARGAPAVAPVVLPISTQGAILARFNATPALIALVPGKLHPAVLDKPPAYPYATIVHVAGVDMTTSGARAFYVRKDRFQVTIYGRSVEACKAALDGFYATFNSRIITGTTPLPLVSGNVFAAAISDERMAPGVETDRSNTPVYRQLFTLGTLTSRPLIAG